MVIRPTTDITNNPTPADTDEVYSSEPSQVWSDTIEDAQVCGDDPWELPVGDPVYLGEPGIDGVDGAIGLTGPAGPIGPVGPTGLDGVIDPNNPPPEWEITNGQTFAGSSFLLTGQYFGPSNGGNMLPSNCIPFQSSDGFGFDTGIGVPWDYTIKAIAIGQDRLLGFAAEFSIGIEIDGVLVWRDDSSFSIGSHVRGSNYVKNLSILVPAESIVRVVFGGGNNPNLTVSFSLSCVAEAGGGACHFKMHQYTWSASNYTMLSLGDRNSYGKEGFIAPFDMEVKSVFIEMDGKPNTNGYMKLYAYSGSTNDINDPGTVYDLSASQTQKIYINRVIRAGEGLRIGIKGDDINGMFTGGGVATFVFDCLPLFDSGGPSSDVFFFTTGDADPASDLGIMSQTFTVPRDGTIASATLTYSTILGTGRYVTMSINGGSAVTIATIEDNITQLGTQVNNIAVVAGDVLTFLCYGGTSGDDYCLAIQMGETGTEVPLSVNNYVPSFYMGNVPTQTRAGCSVFLVDGAKGSGTKGTMAYFDGFNWIAYDSGLPVKSYIDQAHMWRILIVSGGNGAYFGIGDIQMMDTVGGADLTGSGTASSSTERGANTADLAFNGVTTNFWSGNTDDALLEWVAYDFGEPVALAELKMTSRDDVLNYDQMIRDFDLEYSTDGGITWLPSRKFRQVNQYTQNETKTFTL